MNPWETEEGKQVWKSKSQYFVWLRGALRKLWSDYPLRQVWKKEQGRPVTQEERANKVFHPSTKAVAQCVFCGEWMAKSKLEVDHIKESEGCYDFTTAEKFLWHCGGQTGDNFQLACKPCHKIKSHSDSKGISFDEALCDKEAIVICKGDEKAWLISKGIAPASNAKLRRVQVFEHLKECLSVTKKKA
jgi:5-methylcytosine-specific restriction endonuclease McrA